MVVIYFIAQGKHGARMHNFFMFTLQIYSHRKLELYNVSVCIYFPTLTPFLDSCFIWAPFKGRFQAGFSLSLDRGCKGPKHFVLITAH